MSKSGKCESQLIMESSNTTTASAEDRLITYVDKLTWIMKLACIWFSPSLPTWRRILNFAVCTASFVLAFYGMVFETYMLYWRGFAADIITSTTLSAIIWAVQALISGVFLAQWQLCGKFFRYLSDTVMHQNGLYIKEGRKILNRGLIRFHLVNVSMVVLVVLHTFGRKMIKLEEQPRLFYVYSAKWIRLLHSFATLHLFLCWNLTIFIFNMFVNGTYLELHYFNYVLSKIDDKDEEQLKERLLQTIATHGKITRTIRGLDRLYRVYAFSMIATMIPSILMTVVMLSNRIMSFNNIFIMGFPTFVFILYGFLGLTVSPANLYDEAYKSKTQLCLNSAIWLPYRPDVYQIAMALSNHLEQPNMGVTIWGFAVMTKPLILATFSVMAMMLSLMMELLPLKKSSQLAMNSTILS